MRFFRLLQWACVVLSFVMASPLDAGEGAAEKSEKASAQVRASRHVGYLQRNSRPGDSDAPYVVTDVWDNSLYYVTPKPGVDLEPHVNQLVALYGQTVTNIKTKSRTFAVERAVPREAPAARLAGRAAGDDAVRQAGQWMPVRTPGRMQASSSVVESPASPSDRGGGLEEVPSRTPSESPRREVVPAKPAESGELSPFVLDDPFLGAPPPPAPIASGGCFPHFLGPLVDWFSCGNACCATPERFWLRGEYLYWWTAGMDLPPLVTTSPSGTARTQAGVLGESGTTVLFGNSPVNEGPQSGVRVRGGLWIDPRKVVGLEGDYFWLEDQSTTYSATSTGSPILARPFFDMLNARETAELVAFPNVVQGTVSVDATTEFNSAGIRLRGNLCCSEDPCSRAIGCCPTAPDTCRLDWLLGYRLVNLNDRLGIQENLTSLDQANPGSFVLRDQFDTENEFQGVEVGVAYDKRRGPWMLELVSKIALGNNAQRVTIAGSTDITDGGVTDSYTGGLLAQRSNIGQYSRDVFSVVPQLEATLAYQLTQHLRLTVGYTLVYFSNVVRAGDQIDLDLNPNLLPPEVVPFSGPLRPTFAFHDSDFWAHGLSVGGDLRW